MGGFSGDSDDDGYGGGYADSDAKSDLGGMRGSDGTNNDTGSRGESGIVGGRGSNTFDSVQEKEDYVSGISRGDTQSSIAADNLSRLATANADLVSSREAHQRNISDAYDSFGLAGIENQVRDTMLGDFALADDLKDNITSADRAELSRDLASRETNGLLGSLAGFIGPAGSVVNAGIDTYQADNISNKAFGVNPSFGENLSTGLRSGIKGLATNAIAGKAGEIAGSVISGVAGPSVGMVGGLLSSNFAKDKLSDPNTYSSATVTSPTTPTASLGNNYASGLTISPTTPATPTTTEQVTDTVTGYGSSFGNYDSHVNTLDSAIKSWT